MSDYRINDDGQVEWLQHKAAQGELPESAQLALEGCERPLQRTQDRETTHGKGDSMSTDDRDETITDRAAIRASDEPDERGDFPYYDLGPATSETVAALDLDAIEGRARYALEWGDSANKEMILALVAEVRSLRAKVAAVEALATRLESLGVPIPRWYADDIRAALATGEGK